MANCVGCWLDGDAYRNHYPISLSIVESTWLDGRMVFFSRWLLCLARKLCPIATET
jgi:hypothetical protein